MHKLLVMLQNGQCWVNNGKLIMQFWIKGLILPTIRTLKLRTVIRYLVNR